MSSRAGGHSFGSYTKGKTIGFYNLVDLLSSKDRENQNLMSDLDTRISNIVHSISSLSKRIPAHEIMPKFTLFKLGWVRPGAKVSSLSI